MIQVHYKQYTLLPDFQLWLDPQEPRPFAFISHAHSDHIAQHDRTILTTTTAKFMQARYGALKGKQYLLEFHKPHAFEDFSATLLPAGHILGSAQLFLQNEQGTLLYTGDFKRRKGLSAEAATTLPADTLIMETTFGLPQYRFPPNEQIIDDIINFCIETLGENKTPILLGYSLGKSQEILTALTRAHLPIMLHDSIWKLTQIYQHLGIQFPFFEKFDSENVSGKVLLFPPSLRNSRSLQKIPNRRTAILSGWAMNSQAIFRYGCDIGFPLSDHADYTDLLEHVRAIAPKRVLTLHGFAREFARDLRALGYDAWALTAPDQLDLNLPSEAFAEPLKKSSHKLDLLNSKLSAFQRFCSTCEAIRKTTSKQQKIQNLAEFLRQLPPTELTHCTVWLTGNPFPPHDPTPLQTGWAAIQRALVETSGLTHNQFRAIARRNNDAGQTAHDVLLAQYPNTSWEIAAIQDQFEKLRSARQLTTKVELLKTLFQNLSAIEAQYVVRIITGDLRIGLKEGLVEEAIAEAFQCDPMQVRETNMLLGDVGKTAQLGQQHSLHKADLTLFWPTKSMLASPEPTAEAIWDRMHSLDTQGIWLEDKLDGIRAQIHTNGEQVKIFSRDLKQITETFPELADAALAIKRSFILDGEILAYHDGRALSFFELQKRLGRKERDLFISEEIPVAFYAFDALYLDGESLIKHSLSERRASLERLALVAPIYILPNFRANSAESIDDAFSRARKRGNEGLIAKNPQSLYSPGRRGLAWLKLKREFATLDVVITAVEYGHGRRNEVLSDYTFAIRDESTDSLKTIGKAYSGLTDQEIADLTNIFKRLAVHQKGNRIEVKPEIVIEIAFDSIQESKRHSSGLALRFPRIKRLRPDKTVDEIDTLSTARKLLPKPH